MATDERGSSTHPGGPNDTRGRSWFGPNQSGVGYRPQTWQGWLVLGACVAALVVIVVLLRTGLL